MSGTAKIDDLYKSVHKAFDLKSMEFSLFKDQRKSVEVANSKVKSVTSSGNSGFISIIVMLSVLSSNDNTGKIFLPHNHTLKKLPDWQINQEVPISYEGPRTFWGGAPPQEVLGPSSEGPRPLLRYWNLLIYLPIWQFFECMFMILCFLKVVQVINCGSYSNATPI